MIKCLPLYLIFIKCFCCSTNELCTYIDFLVLGKISYLNFVISIKKNINKIILLQPCLYLWQPPGLLIKFIGLKHFIFNTLSVAVYRGIIFMFYGNHKKKKYLQLNYFECRQICMLVFVFFTLNT